LHWYEAHGIGRKETKRKRHLYPAEWFATVELPPRIRRSLRVFYAVSHERREVQILAIGAKQGNRLMVGGEEIRL